MTLDEAIVHCMEQYVRDKDKPTECECAKEHLQLAEWLTELKNLRKRLNKPQIK